MGLGGGGCGYSIGGEALPLLLSTVQHAEERDARELPVQHIKEVSTIKCPEVVENATKWQEVVENATQCLEVVETATKCQEEV